jgi:DNA-binding response OmpR family regulator
MRVLIVEDEKDMAQVLKGGLEEENHLVSLAFDGITGLEVARACDFDVIVLDVMLPKLDGFEVARRLRACFSKPLRRVCKVASLAPLGGTATETKGTHLPALQPQTVRS